MAKVAKVAKKSTKAGKDGAKADAPFDPFAAVLKAEASAQEHVSLSYQNPADLLSVGSLAIDLALGGGYPSGRIIQFYGPAHSGKSTSLYSSAALAQKRRIGGVFYDFEGTTDRVYVENPGIDMNMGPDARLRYYRPGSGVEAYENMLEILLGLPDKSSGPPQLMFMIDTIAEMSAPGETKNNQPARRAAMHSKWLTANIKPLIAKKHCTVLAANQVRASMNMYGDPQSIPGAAAWAFGTDSLVSFRGGKKVSHDGAWFAPVTVKTRKNKNFVSEQETTVYMRLGYGYDPASDVVAFLKMTGLAKKSKDKGKEAIRIEGLEPYGEGENVDKEWSSITKMETELRVRGMAHDCPIAAACRRMITSGDAVKVFTAFKTADARRKAAKADEMAGEGGDTGKAVAFSLTKAAKKAKKSA